MKEEFDFESIKNKAIEQLRAGKPLLGKDGAFAPLLESILNAALEGEMDAHLTEEERQMGNRRNGKMQKQVQTPLGEVTVSTPRDRNSSFDPQFIKKRETIPLLQEKKYTIQATYTTGIKENHTGQKCKNRYISFPVISPKAEMILLPFGWIIYILQTSSKNYGLNYNNH